MDILAPMTGVTPMELPMTQRMILYWCPCVTRTASSSSTGEQVRCDGFLAITTIGARHGQTSYLSQTAQLLGHFVNGIARSHLKARSCASAIETPARSRVRRRRTTAALSSPL